MLSRVWVCAAAVLTVASASNACVRKEMDERAVQWSTAIVEAKLLSIDPPQRLQGEVKIIKPFEGTITMYYYYRLYHMEVTQTLDGSLKKGDPVSIVRLFWRGKQTRCQQYLDQTGIGKEFLLLLMPTTKFKAFVPEGVTRPKVKDAMFIIHLESKETVSPGVMTDLEQRIRSVRAAESMIDPKQVDRLIDQIKKAPDPQRSGPSVRALVRMGPKVVPQVEAALDAMESLDAKAKHVVPAGEGDLSHVVEQLAPPPTTAGLVWPDQNIEDSMGKK